MVVELIFYLYFSLIESLDTKLENNNINTVMAKSFKILLFTLILWIMGYGLGAMLSDSNPRNWSKDAKIGFAILAVGSGAFAASSIIYFTEKKSK